MKSDSWLRSFVVVASLLLAACGGGGDGGGGTANTSGSAGYSGVTTQASVTTSNATDLSVDAYEGGQAGTALNFMSVAVGGQSVAAAASPRLQGLVNTLKESVSQVLSNNASSPPTLVGASYQYTYPGPAGGSLTYTISVNEGSGAFTGTITYNDYKFATDGPTVSGSVTFSGVYNTTYGTFSSFTVTFNALTFTYAAVAHTATGSVTLTRSGTTETTSVSMTTTDPSTGRTYWVKDYTYTLNTSGTLTISGTYYNPVYGYVTISTLTPLTVTSLGEWPNAGVLLFSGANNSKARLTFTSTSYIVEVDPDGSGSYTTVP